MTTRTHPVLIIGGGTAGISVAARLRRKGVSGVTVIEPSATHFYQPLWTLVGGGLADPRRSARPERSVMPSGVTWIRSSAVAVDPQAHTVTLDDGGAVGYETLVVAPGIQLDWDGVAGLPQALGRDGVSSNYAYELAPATWRFIESTTRGTAVFTQPNGPIKCAGAPQKIAYLACDHWRRQGVLDDIDVHLVLPTPAMFGVKVFSDVLEQVVQRYGITVHFTSEVTEVDTAAREVVVRGIGGDATTRLPYDVLHATPPQSAPDWIKASPLADPNNPFGYVEVDRGTLQHTRYPDVFALGDAGSTPNSKTGAAIRKQAPVVVENVLAHRAGRTPSAVYGGYASCPLTTARDTLLLAEFDYTLQPTPSLPVVDTTKELKEFGLFKRVGLPNLYWNLMLKGLA